VRLGWIRGWKVERGEVILKAERGEVVVGVLVGGWMIS
jgi:hypothetical protein